MGIGTHNSALSRGSLRKIPKGGGQKFTGRHFGGGGGGGGGGDAYRESRGGTNFPKGGTNAPLPPPPPLNEALLSMHLHVHDFAT